MKITPQRNEGSNKLNGQFKNKTQERLKQRNETINAQIKWKTMKLNKLWNTEAQMDRYN